MRVAFRVDASPAIGTGHLMRCLTLADALKQHGASIRFVSREMPEHLCESLSQRGHELSMLGGDSNMDGTGYARWLAADETADAQQTAGSLRDRYWDWLVVDHYGFGIRWESLMRSCANRILAIDDLADREHDCDVLLDQNFYADMDVRYAGKVPRHCQLLLGPRYALLRAQFLEERRRIRPRPGTVRRVLICFGGVDAENYTGRAVQAVAELNNPGLHVDVVIGAQHPCRVPIESACAAHGFICHVQTDEMAKLMGAADIAIGAGGSTSWERCCLGLPAVAITLAENQSRLIEDAAREGLLYAPALSRGEVSRLKLHLEALIDNPLLLQMISRKALEAVDGRGVQRVLRSLGCSSIKMREAAVTDSRMLFEWRNHDSARSVSRNNKLIEWSSHENWFHAVLSDPNRLLLIGERDGVPVGTVRFDVDNGEAEVSIYLAPDYIGSGIGADLLLLAESWLLQFRCDVQLLNAHVLENNERSHRLFRTAGYVPRSLTYAKRALRE